MSDGGEKTCPLCAEEMDLTDQHLKPCKCGYDICVWCWHHIMDMAEKDETEGRCPACRNPYNKEKIVGTAASRGRLVSEMNVEKKVKSQKGKNKTSEGRKQLASVRVIQRNLVYVMGLPLDLTDEDLLQHREYFGQYGKVLKVSISRTAGGAIQQFPNSTCSVYITYSKEEEAVRCIQSVHGYVLDGRPLRACFGTTKYCHAWLRNVPCTNPDCLYLHEIGSHEDSFTKDETISAYTRSRVQQFTGSSNSMQQRSGNVLPPPFDDYCNNSTASSVKPISKAAVTINNSAVSTKHSPPNSSSGRSAALPAGASWGTRSFNNQHSLTNTPGSNGPLKQKSDICNGAVASSTEVSSPSQVSSLQRNSGKILVPNEESTISEDKTESSEPVKNESSTDRRIYVSESSFASQNSAILPINRQPPDEPTAELPSNSNNLVDSPTASGTSLDKYSVDVPNGNMENVCSNILSMSIHEDQHSNDVYVKHNRETLTSQTSAKAANSTEEIRVTNGQSDFGLGTLTEATQFDMHEAEDDLLSFDNQRLKDPEVSINRIPDHSNTFHLSNHSILYPQLNNGDLSIHGDFDRQVVNRNSNLVVSTSNFPTEHPQDILNSSEVNGVEFSNLFPSKERKLLLGRYDGEAVSGTGENSEMSNILSMDFDPWDESLTSPQNLSNLLGETERRRGAFGVPGPKKSQNSNQSRFSFAREEPMAQASDFGQSVDYFDQGFKHRPSADFRNSSGLHIEKFASLNGFPAFNGTKSDIFASNHSQISSNKLSVSRSQISAPPGFSVPSRAPPPGFTSHERTEQILDTFSGNRRVDATSFLRNQYQTHSSGHNTISNGDIEFMDPAILAVGKGTLPSGINNPNLDMRSSFSPQFSTYEESRFQSFLQRSVPPHQNQRYSDSLDSFAPLCDAYGISSRLMEQTLNNNLSPYSQFNHPQHRNTISSNGQWDGWNEGQNANNNFGMAELLRNDRLGYNNFYGGYEDAKIRMPSSGNLYNGKYGI